MTDKKYTKEDKPEIEPDVDDEPEIVEEGSVDASDLFAQMARALLPNALDIGHGFNRRHGFTWTDKTIDSVQEFTAAMAEWFLQELAEAWDEFDGDEFVLAPESYFTAETIDNGDLILIDKETVEPRGVVGPDRLVLATIFVEDTHGQVALEDVRPEPEEPEPGKGLFDAPPHFGPTTEPDSKAEEIRRALAEEMNNI